MVCSVCGEDLQYTIKGSNQGKYCRKCDFWGAVATYIPPKE
jgi:hypothetical protein